MSYGEYMARIDRAQSDLERGGILLEAARDKELSTAEFIRLDNWAKRLMNERKGKRG